MQGALSYHNIKLVLYWTQALFPAGRKAEKQPHEALKSRERWERSNLLLPLHSSNSGRVSLQYLSASDQQSDLSYIPENQAQTGLTPSPLQSTKLVSEVIRNHQYNS